MAQGLVGAYTCTQTHSCPRTHTCESIHTHTCIDTQVHTHARHRHTCTPKYTHTRHAHRHTWHTYTTQVYSTQGNTTGAHAHTPSHRHAHGRSHGVCRTHAHICKNYTQTHIYGTYTHTSTLIHTHVWCTHRLHRYMYTHFHIVYAAHTLTHTRVQK